MGRQTIITAGALAVLSALLLTGSQGCGGGHGTSQNGFGLLAPDLERLTSRLQAHYDTVRGAVGARITTAEAPDWEAVQTEWEEYGQQMHDILNDLGEKTTMVGACQMMMGGMTIGRESGGGTCPCQAYMDDATEELDGHLSTMLGWMDRRDPDSLWEEMGRHMQQMGVHIRNMASHMAQLYGTDGMMNGGMGMMM